MQEFAAGKFHFEPPSIFRSLDHLVGDPPKVCRAHACCGIVSNVCCDVSASRGAVFEVSAAPPPKPAISCTSWELEPELPMDPVGGSAAKPPSCQSVPTEP